MIRRINESLMNTNPVSPELTIEDIDRKLSECASRMIQIKEEFEETKLTWKSLKEDVEGMTFGTYIHSGLQDQFKQTLADLKSEYNTLKTTYKSFQDLKTKLQEDAENTMTVWVQKDISEDADPDGCVYSGNNGLNWVTKDSPYIDTWASEAEAIDNGSQSFKEEFEFGVDWTVVPLQRKVEILKEDLTSVFTRYYTDSSNRANNPTGFGYVDRLIDRYNVDTNNLKDTFSNVSEENQLRMIELIAPRSRG